MFQFVLTIRTTIKKWVPKPIHIRNSQLNALKSRQSNASNERTERCVWSSQINALFSVPLFFFLLFEWIKLELWMRICIGIQGGVVVVEDRGKSRESEATWKSILVLMGWPSARKKIWSYVWQSNNWSTEYLLKYRSEDRRDRYINFTCFLAFDQLTVIDAVASQQKLQTKEIVSHDTKKYSVPILRESRLVWKFRQICDIESERWKNVIFNSFWILLCKSV
jgi:hypothetical protein